MSKRSGKILDNWLIFIIMAAFLLLVPLPIRFRFFLLAILGLAALSFGAYLLWLYVKKRRAEKAFLETEEGAISSRIDYCREQMDRNEEEMAEIRQSITELEARRADYTDIAPHNQRETERLIDAFRSELKLRQTKINFYASCIRKLEGILRNHLLAQEIAEKQQRLRQLKENHYEELAEMEALKSDVELDILHLDTIEQLSDRMLESTDLDDAQRLSLELEEMTRDLEK